MDFYQYLISDPNYKNLGPIDRAILKALFSNDEARPSPDPVTLANLPLRTSCRPDEIVGRDDHKHLCSCGTAWKHSDWLSGNPHITHHQFTVAHTCPNCGNEVRTKHY
jgi:hypothetical protein